MKRLVGTCLVFGLSVPLAMEREALSCPPAPFAAADQPDLVLESHKSEADGRFWFTVRNAGNAAARSSRLKIACENVVTAPERACTSTAPQIVNVPPLPKGAVFQTPALLVTTPGAGVSVPGPPAFRLRITVDVDAERQVAEADEGNNTTVIVVETAPAKAPSASGGSGSASSSRQKPHVILEMESPFSLTSATWLVARNVGSGDSAIAGAQLLSCRVVRKDGGSSVPPCRALYPRMPEEVDVPAIKAGSFLALYEIPAARFPPGLDPGWYRVELLYLLSGAGSTEEFRIVSR